MGRGIGMLFLAVLLALSNAALLQASCSVYATPRIIPPTKEFLLYEGKRFTYDFNLANMNESGTYGFGLLDGNLSNIAITHTGLISITAGENDSKNSVIAVIAYQGMCANVLIVNTTLLSKPRILTALPIQDNVIVDPELPTLFSILTSSSNPDRRIRFDWFLDNVRISNATRSSYSTIFGDNVSGNHTLAVTAYDYYGLTASHYWNLTIIHINRAPKQKAEVPSIILYLNTESGAYSLNDYFYDPENAKLTFESRKLTPSFENITYVNVSVKIDKEGFVTYYPETNSTGTGYFIFTAIDPQGLMAESNTVKVDVLEKAEIKKRNSTVLSEFCGDNACNALENCTTCPEDCGVCSNGTFTGCKPAWNCTNWGPCQPDGILARSCTDMNLCGDNRSMPNTNQSCNYTGNCTDAIKSGIEEGIDCGGPCEPCPSCNDSKQNQNESGIDCGGPCQRCTSCIDRVKNQNESDIDCGGNCQPCEGNKSCSVNKDCASLSCRYLKCQSATCNDEIKNQGEGGIDCGGPCEKICNTCSDGIQNGNEEGVDCSGMCKPCPSCQDGVKNQGETIIDCGGQCRKCTLKDYTAYFFSAILLFLIVVGSILAGMLFFLIYVSTRPEDAEIIYGTNSLFVIFLGMHGFLRRLKRIIGGKPFIDKDAYTSYRTQLMSVAGKAGFTNKELHSVIKKILSSIFLLPDQFDDKWFFRKVKESKLSLFLKILVIGYYRKISLLSEEIFIPPDEVHSFIAEMKYLLIEMSKI
jgi:hypothetical protein